MGGALTHSLMSVAGCNIVQPKFFAEQKFYLTRVLEKCSTKWPCGKDCRYRLYVIINMGQKSLHDKILPTRAGYEKGETFLQAKISSSTII